MDNGVLSISGRGGCDGTVIRDSRDLLFPIFYVPVFYSWVKPENYIIHVCSLYKKEKKL
jgi:hypothetical protein